MFTTAAQIYFYAYIIYILYITVKTYFCIIMDKGNDKDTISRQTKIVEYWQSDRQMDAN